MTVTVLLLPSATCSAETIAPEMYGAPILVSFPSSISKTLSNVIFPSVAGSFSTFKTVSCVTKYCFPPVSIISIFAIRGATITRLLVRCNRRFVQKRRFNAYGSFRDAVDVLIYFSEFFVPTVIVRNGRAKRGTKLLIEFFIGTDMLPQLAHPLLNIHGFLLYLKRFQSLHYGLQVCEK